MQVMNELFNNPSAIDKFMRSTFGNRETFDEVLACRASFDLKPLSHKAFTCNAYLLNGNSFMCTKTSTNRENDSTDERVMVLQTSWGLFVMDGVWRHPRCWAYFTSLPPMELHLEFRD